ncbi:hypothetical protein GALMADRAFT_1327321 [Galerina marginata CBS 339.88]|uniref:Uncharacterized protein n=1 Tax=Galerina marginata (strain CBS 339.88) TaxID=685588 RepID=A0A067TB12_GALM3|nr:hypothetical protein GALMADRAFT_1327321 [Galerina marginata CBS 339.88]
MQFGKHPFWGAYQHHPRGGSCSKNQTNVIDPIEGGQAVVGCECCAFSGVISSFDNFCPTTDPAVTGLVHLNTSQTSITSFSTCSPYLSQFNCTADLGFSSAAVGGTFLRPDNLPATGTATLTNVPGTVTAPASGTVFTYTNNAQVYTISAANVGGGRGVSGSGSGTMQGNSAGKAALNGVMVLVVMVGAVALLGRV